LYIKEYYSEDANNNITSGILLSPKVAIGNLIDEISNSSTLKVVGDITATGSVIADNVTFSSTNGNEIIITGQFG